MSDYAGSGTGSPDSFGWGSGNVVKQVDARTGILWALGFGAIDANGVPAVVWGSVSTWAVAKQRLGGTWGIAKGAATWAQAKALAAA